MGRSSVYPEKYLTTMASEQKQMCFMVMWQKAHGSVLVSQLWTSLVVEWADWAISNGELEHYVLMLSFLYFLTQEIES
jgi:hypothetical protein